MTIFNKGKRTAAAAMCAVVAGAIAMSLAVVPTASGAPVSAAAAPSVVSDFVADTEHYCTNTTTLHSYNEGPVIGTVLAGDSFSVWDYYTNWAAVEVVKNGDFGWIDLAACEMVW